MKPLRTLLSLALTGSAAVASPAAAQFFFQPPKLTGAPVTGAEPGIVTQALPGATPDELKAALVWNLRAGLNVAALQCQFKPTLLSLHNYNKILGDHGTELNAAYGTLGKYFERTAKTKKAGQTALDQYGTRVYSSFSTVGAQLTFCQTASEIATLAIFAPRGSFGTLAVERMQELRNSLTLSGEQRFPWFVAPTRPRLPALDDRCWKKGEWQAKKCGPQLYG
jgi:hypothetical protein